MAVLLEGCAHQVDGVAALRRARRERLIVLARGARRVTFAGHLFLRSQRLGEVGADDGALSTD